MDEIIQGKYLDPLTDFGFKKLFFNELNKELLIDFLNEVVQEQGKITDIRYLPTEQLGDEASNQKAVFDIFCTNEKGEYFIVELQKARQPYFRDRSLFYSSFPIRHQAPKGIWNFQLKAVYLVAILDFVVFDEFKEDKEQVIEQVRLFRERTKTVYSKKLNFTFIELPKFRKQVHELETNVDRWLFSLRNLSRLESRPLEVQGWTFEMLFKALEIKQLTNKEMEEYRKSILEYQDVRDAVDYAREEGEEKGIEIGLEKGMEKEKLLIAGNCLKEGLSTEVISKITGLDIIDIEALKK